MDKKRRMSKNHPSLFFYHPRTNTDNPTFILELLIILAYDKSKALYDNASEFPEESSASIPNKAAI